MKPKINIHITMITRKLILASALALVLAACTTSGNDSKQSSSPASQATPAQQESVNSDTASVSSIPHVSLEGAKVPITRNNITPKSPKASNNKADNMLKQYNEEFLKLVQESKSGKAIDTKAIDKLLSELNALEKNGKLSETQKQLLKATTDAYEQFKNK